MHRLLPYGRMIGRSFRECLGDCAAYVHRLLPYGRIIGRSFRECLGGCAACGLFRENFSRLSDLYRTGLNSIWSPGTGELNWFGAEKVGLNERVKRYLEQFHG